MVARTNPIGILFEFFRGARLPEILNASSLATDSTGNIIRGSAWMPGSNTTAYSSTAAAPYVTVPASSTNTLLATLSPADAGSYATDFNAQLALRPANVAAQNRIAMSDLVSDLQGLASTSATHAVAFGAGETLLPGVYDVAGGAISASGSLTFDAGGDSDATFVIRGGAAINFSAGTAMSLANGAQSCNVFWLAPGAINSAAGVIGVGSLIGTGTAAVGLGAGCVWSGRLLCAGLGAVTSNNSTINVPTGVSKKIRLGNLQNFVGFSVGGDVTNTGNASGVGDICIGSTATTLAAWAGMSGNIYTQAGSNCRISVGVYIAGVLIPGSRRVVESLVFGFDEIATAALAVVTAGQAIDVRINVDCGAVAVPMSFLSVDRKA